MTNQHALTAKSDDCKLSWKKKREKKNTEKDENEKIQRVTGRNANSRVCMLQ